MTKLNSTGSALVFSTCLGGNGDDEAMAIALDGSNNIWTTGASESNNFPTTADAYHMATGQAAFLANLNSTGTKLLFSSFVSNGGEFDQGMGVALDTNGNVYAVGQEGDLPIFPIAPGFNCLGWSPGSCECNRDVSTVNGVQRHRVRDASRFLLSSPSIANHVRSAQWQGFRVVFPLQLLQLHKFAQLVPPFWVLSLQYYFSQLTGVSVGMHHLQNLHVDKGEALSA